MCPNCRAFITVDDKVCPYCDVQLGPRARDVMGGGGGMLGFLPQGRGTTIAILTVSFVLYLMDELTGGNAIKGAGASLPWRRIQFYGEYYRLVTAGFMHGGIFHIFMNSWALFNLGYEVETLYDANRLVVIYFVSTVTGFLASSLFGHVSVGSSAGIFGLFGVMIAFGVTDRSALGAAVKAHYGQWAIFGLVMSFLPGTDYMAHIGGFAGGFAMALLLSTPRARAMWKEPLIRAGAGLSIAVTVLCFGQMILHLAKA